MDPPVTIGTGKSQARVASPVGGLTLIHSFALWIYAPKATGNGPLRPPPDLLRRTRRLSPLGSVTRGPSGRTPGRNAPPGTSLHLQRPPVALSPHPLPRFLGATHLPGGTIYGTEGGIELDAVASW
jgi:hypothetical protein